MSSPARLSASATSAGYGGGSSSNAGFGDDASSNHYSTDLVTAQDRKGEALNVLKGGLMAELHKEVKALDDDNWKFAGPRSQFHLITRPVI